jgi:hypothetical protein
MHAKADEVTSQSAFIRVHFLGSLLLHYLMNAASIVKTKHVQCFYTLKSNPSPSLFRHQSSSAIKRESIMIHHHHFRYALHADANTSTVCLFSDSFVAPKHTPIAPEERYIPHSSRQNREAHRKRRRGSARRRRYMHWNNRKGTKMAPRRPVAVRDRKRPQSARQAMAKLNKAIGVLSRLSSWRESRCSSSAIRCLAASAESLVYN